MKGTLASGLAPSTPEMLWSEGCRTKPFYFYKDGEIASGMIHRVSCGTCLNATRVANLTHCRNNQSSSMYNHPPDAFTEQEKNQPPQNKTKKNMISTPKLTFQAGKLEPHVFILLAGPRSPAPTAAKNKERSERLQGGRRVNSIANSVHLCVCISISIGARA